MKRPRQPPELATAFVMLPDPLSSYISGANIAVTGGEPILGPAKRLAHDLIWRGRDCIPGQGCWHVLVGSREHRDKFFELREIAIVNGSRDCLLDEMIARNDGGIGCAHHRHTLLHGDIAVVSQSTAPCLGPGIVGGRIGE